MKLLLILLTSFNFICSFDKEAAPIKCDFVAFTGQSNVTGLPIVANMPCAKIERQDSGTGALLLTDLNTLVRAEGALDRYSNLHSLPIANLGLSFSCRFGQLAAYRGRPFYTALIVNAMPGSSAAQWNATYTAMTIQRINDGLVAFPGSRLTAWVNQQGESDAAFPQNWRVEFTGTYNQIRTAFPLVPIIVVGLSDEAGRHRAMNDTIRNVVASLANAYYVPTTGINVANGHVTNADYTHWKSSGQRVAGARVDSVYQQVRIR